MQTDNTSQDLMLTIEQVSQLTGVRKSTLRYWEKSFEEFLKPARTHSNRREYTMDDLDLIKTIKRLLEEEHLTSEGVRLKLLKIYPHHTAKGKCNPIRLGNNQKVGAGPPGTIPFQIPKR
jgi:DNA-binding transcriptional MerR regulator